MPGRRSKAEETRKLPYFWPWAKAAPPQPPQEEIRAEEPQVLPYFGPWAKATPPQEENMAVRTLRLQGKEWRRLQRRKPRPQEDQEWRESHIAPSEDRRHAAHVS